MRRAVAYGAVGGVLGGLQLGSTLEPRTKSLLQRIARHLEERHRQALGRGEAP